MGAIAAHIVQIFPGSLAPNRHSSYFLLNRWWQDVNCLEKAIQGFPGSGSDQIINLNARCHAILTSIALPIIVVYIDYRPSRSMYWLPISLSD